MLLSKALQMQ
jgi:hypothetical protein